MPKKGPWGIKSDPSEGQSRLSVCFLFLTESLLGSLRGRLWLLSYPQWGLRVELEHWPQQVTSGEVRRPCPGG